MGYRGMMSSSRARSSELRWKTAGAQLFLRRELLMRRQRVCEVLCVRYWVYEVLCVRYWVNEVSGV